MNTGFNQAFGYTQSGGFGNGFSRSAIATPAGLVLQYDIWDSDCYPGSGATVTDLQGNSNATLYNSPSYASGQLSFNGSNQYLYTTTSLNTKVPTDVTTVIMWAYLQGNGVILSERGAGGLASSWHDSQMEMVTGTMKFRMWNGGAITSSVATPLNSWYHLAIVYNGSTLYAYVNGTSAGSKTFPRLNPGENSAELHYAIGAADTTNLGNGNYANMKLGQFLVYNTALNSSDITNNFDSTKNRFGL